MGFSRQFRALGRVGAFFAGAWGAVGAAFGFWGSGTLAAMVTFGVMFGAIGAAAVLGAGLLLSAGESGRRFESLQPWRVAAWGFVVGFAPAAALSGIALVLGTAAAAIPPLLGVGAVSGMVVGGLGTAASRTVRRGEVEPGAERPSLPAT